MVLRPANSQESGSVGEPDSTVEPSFVLHTSPRQSDKEAWRNDEGIRDVGPELGGFSVQIQLTARHVEVTDDVRNYIQEKVDKLPRFYDRIHEVEVVLDHQSEQFSVEMIVRTDRRHTIVVSETGPDTFALIDVLTDRLERQLTKHKEKNRNHKHDGRAEPPTG